MEVNIFRFFYRKTPVVWHRRPLLNLVLFVFPLCFESLGFISWIFSDAEGKKKKESRKEEIEGRSVADSIRDGAKFAKLGLRWGKGAELAPKKIAEGTFGAQLWRTCGKDSHLEADFGPKLVPRGGQDGEVRAKMAASWGQEQAKRAKRRLEKRSWAEKSDFETCRCSLGIYVFRRYRAAKWGKLEIQF